MSLRSRGVWQFCLCSLLWDFAYYQKSCAFAVSCKRTVLDSCTCVCKFVIFANVCKTLYIFVYLCIPCRIFVMWLPLGILGSIFHYPTVRRCGNRLSLDAWVEKVSPLSHAQRSRGCRHAFTDSSRYLSLTHLTFISEPSVRRQPHQCSPPSCITLANVGVQITEHNIFSCAFSSVTEQSVRHAEAFLDGFPDCAPAWGLDKVHRRWTTGREAVRCWVCLSSIGQTFQSGKHRRVQAALRKYTVYMHKVYIHTHSICLPITARNAQERWLREFWEM